MDAGDVVFLRPVTLHARGGHDSGARRGLLAAWLTDAFKIDSSKGDYCPTSVDGLTLERFSLWKWRAASRFRIYN